MRVIKFRAWHNQAKNMSGSHTALHIIMDRNIKMPDTHNQLYIIMQFTWLYDNAGKEIYEWDILAEWSNAVICFYEWKFTARHDGGDGEEIEEDLRNFSKTVIWNIYENPELLNQE